MSIDLDSGLNDGVEGYGSLYVELASVAIVLNYVLVNTPNNPPLLSVIKDNSFNLNVNLIRIYHGLASIDLDRECYGQERAIEPK